MTWSLEYAMPGCGACRSSTASVGWLECCRWVNRGGPTPDWSSATALRRAPLLQQLAHRCHQPIHLDRLAQMHVEAARQQIHAVRLAAPAGERDHRELFARGHRAQPLGDF